MDLTLDYFSNFSVERSFSVSVAELATRHRELQQNYHPDRYIGADAAKQRRAIQIAAYINEAFETLHSPLKRAIYLLQLEGMEPLSATNTHMPHDFLLQQMSWREQMEDLSQVIDDVAAAEIALDAMQDELTGVQTQLQTDFAEQYQTQQWQAAETTVRKMQFIHKLIMELDELADQWL